MRALVILVVLSVVPARAVADKPAPDAKAPDAKALAERHFRAGEKAYRAQMFAAAATHFEEAYKVLPLPEIAFSAAQAYRRHYRTDSKLEYAKRSVELYKAYLDQVKSGGRVGVAADSLGEMQREVDKLTAAGARVVAPVSVERTRLAVSPVLGVEEAKGMSEVGDLADVSATKVVTRIDGKEVPPYEPVDVEPGPHTVRVEADGYLPEEQTYRLVRGQVEVADVRLRPRPARLAIKTDRRARIRIDGRAITFVPGTPVEVPAGRHVLTIVRSGRGTVSREVDVERGQELTVEAPLQKTARRRVLPYVVTAAGVFGAFTIAGVVYAVSEDGKASDQLAAIDGGDQRPAAADRYEQLIQRRDRAVTGSIVTGGATLLLAGAAAALFFLDRPSDEGMQLAPAIGAGGAGVTLGGRF